MRLSATQPDDISRRLRSTPIVLSKAVQLSRLDRIFVDHLFHTVELWHSARRHQRIHQSDMGVRVASESGGLGDGEGEESCTRLTDYSEIPEENCQAAPSVSSEKAPEECQRQISEALAHSYAVVLAQFPGKL